MMTRGIEVIAPGPLSTVQDHGRHGVQHLGFSPTGAVDRYALTAGNLLLGNDPAAAAIEITLGDALFRLHGDHLFVVAGAEADIDLDGRPLQPWCVHDGTNTAMLRIGHAHTGARVYLCIAGGIDVPLAHGSRSTDLVARIGGHEGCALREGDMLPTGATGSTGATGPVGRRLAPVARPLQHGLRVVRAVPGPQRGAFTQQSERTLYDSLYRVSPRADRTGLYLDGPRLSHVGRPDILSEGVTAGSIQVPGDGQPLVLLAEHRSVGGYAKIATVCASDLACLGQARSGDRLVLVETDHAAAQTAYRAFRHMCRHSATGSAVTSTQAPLSFEEWVAAVDMVIDQVITDVRLPLLRSDLHALRARLAATGHGRDSPARLFNGRIQTVMPDAAFPVARAYARATGTLLALHTHAASAPRGVTLAALWSPGILTPVIVMHPLESYRLHPDVGARVRDGDLLVEGVFATALGMIDSASQP